MNIEEIENKLAGYFSTRPEIEVGYIFGSRRSGKENKLEHGLQIAIQSLIDIGGPLMKYHKVICLAVVMLLGFAGKISAQQLGEALDDSTYTWVTGGNADWFGQTAVSYFGGDAVQSGAIGNSSQTYIQTVVTGPVNAGFYYKVSSEEGADFLRLYIDGALTASWSGEVNWTAGSYYVASGTHAVKFVYQKDGTISSGSDAAWVDYFTISPETYPPGKPLNFTATGGGLQAGLSWTAPGNDGYTGDVSSGAYEIRYSSTSGSTPLTAQYAVTISSAWVQGSTNTYSITGLWPESAYYFWIKAKDEAGNWSVWSDTASAIPSGFTDINAGLTGVYLASLSWGDYDNDGDLDLALAGYTGSAWISKIYRSGYSQLQTNSAPSKPISGFTAQPDYNTAKLTLDWNASTDAETPALGLHYEIIMSTVDMNANPAWRPYVVSVTSGAGTGTGGWQNIGNYPHGFISAAHQPGMILSSFQENTTYYWKVRAIDTGLAKSSWSVQQASFIPYAPPSVASISPNSRINAVSRLNKSQQPH
ncbi:MAG: hypothetical protein HY796_06450 [Elusimicrobia bacterium]|nr:hypothetical protein [Elusimicrobiota bacterium]